MTLTGSFFEVNGNVLHVHTNWRVNVLEKHEELNSRKNWVENDGSSYTKSNLCLKRKLVDFIPQVDIKRMSKSKVARSVDFDDNGVSHGSSVNTNDIIFIDSSEDMHSEECLPVVTASEYETLKKKLAISEMKLAERKMKVTSLKIRLASLEQKFSEKRYSAQNKDKKIFDLERMLESKNQVIDELTKLDPSKYLNGKSDVTEVVKELEMKLNTKEILVKKLEESLNQKEKDIVILKSTVSELEVKLNDKDIYINTLEDSFKMLMNSKSLGSRNIDIETTGNLVDNDCKELVRSGQDMKSEEDCPMRLESDLTTSLDHDHDYTMARAEERLLDKDEVKASAEELLLSVKSFANGFRIGNVGNMLVKDEVIVLDENC